MKLRMLYFAPGQVAPGMTLAKAVVDREGVTLLAAATVLSAETLERLIRRRIEAVCVQVPDNRDEQTVASELHAARSRVDAIFRGQGSAARQALHAAILDYRRESTQ